MPRLLTFVAMLFATSATLAAPPTEADILQWIRDLEDPKFKQRVFASAKLKEAGTLAIPHLSKPALDGSPETSDRVMKLLAEFTQSKDPMLAELATKVVRELAKEEGQIASAAEQILNERRHALIRLMEEAGGVMYQTDNLVRYVVFDKLSAADMPRFIKLLGEFPEVESFSARNISFDDQCAVHLAKNLPNLLDVNLYGSSLTDEGLKSIARLSKLNHLPMGKTKITDAGLKHLTALKDLNYIGLSGNSITDVGVRELTCHGKLTGLNLGETKISDAAVALLKAFPNLRRLHLQGTKISDTALESLAKQKELEEAWLLNTATTFEGRAKLKAALPNLKIAED